MRSAHEELDAFTRLRGRLVGELGLCLVVAVALVAVAPLVDAAAPEAKTVFLAAAGLFGFATVRLVPRLVPVLRFRCPRCTGRFHAAAPRRQQLPIVSVRSCAHCGFAPSRSDGAPV